MSTTEKGDRFLFAAEKGDRFLFAEGPARPSLSPSGVEGLASVSEDLRPALPVAAGKRNLSPFSRRKRNLSPFSVREGYALCRAITRRHARSFYLSSFLIAGARRDAAFALYGFCRRLDDLVDVSAPADLPAALARGRELIAAVHRGEVPLEPAGPWTRPELLALADTISRFSIPRRPFDDLLEGMEMDLVKSRYASFEELRHYCYCVAGTVGLLLSHVLGYRQPEALDRAVELGVAMQLTNILRDIREDAERGRIYLPQDELAAFGISDADVLHGVRNERWSALLKCQIARARAFYARAAVGVPMLRGGRWMVRAMGAIYGGILAEIERRGLDVFSSRAVVPTRTKLRLLAGAALASVPPAGLLPVPQLPTAAVRLLP